MTTDLTTPAPGHLERPEVTDDQMALIRDTIAQGATDEQLKLFLYDNSRRGVHPLDKMIHFTLRSGRYTPITSIDFMRSRAAASGAYAGNDDAVFVAGTNGRPKSATVTVYRLVGGQRCPFSATARWDEYYPGDGDQSFLWRKMPHVLLGKCSECLALRKGFPQELSGLYAREEMDQAGAPDNSTAVALDVSAPPPATHPPVTAIEETEAPQGDIPAGTWRLTRIQERQKKNGESFWSVTAVADDGEEHRMTMWDDLSAICMEVIQSCEPVLLDTKKGSYRGDLQYTLKGIHRRTVDGDTTPDEEEAPPAPDELGPPVLDLEEIPF